jgi:hypothetical protein
MFNNERWPRNRSAIVGEKDLNGNGVKTSNMFTESKQEHIDNTTSKKKEKRRNKLLPYLAYVSSIRHLLFPARRENVFACACQASESASQIYASNACRDGFGLYLYPFLSRLFLVEISH